MRVIHVRPNPRRLNHAIESRSAWHLSLVSLLLRVVQRTTSALLRALFDALDLSRSNRVRSDAMGARRWRE